MISKEELLECSVANFTTFGSKRFTMDELAHCLGISKKTIYKYYSSKEELVIASVTCLIDSFNENIKEIIAKEQDPLSCIILLYKRGFEYLKHFKPSFIFGLKKYYPEANKVFDDFRDEFVNEIIYGLLQKAQVFKFISSDVNIKLFCELYFKRFEEIAFKDNTLFDTYSNDELLNHFVIFSLKGIINSDYENPHFKKASF
ncbi:TetR/AcrR family transcriptional regulator [Gaetbulibacter sp. PBL-D1]|uniref:TetR/AcrR family transcriptional regulator n=1 Tax=Gaetbulibacter sp. PBL-D1 TaxID=3422594 RepID=UPI003D2F48BA